MKNAIYLRPLDIKDAETSVKWRNNPKIWRHSKFRPSHPITLEVEQNWILNCLRKNECRFAICLTENHEYIGNVQIVDIENGRGVFHLFIGEEKHWGKGIGKQATHLILNHAFSVLKLDVIKLEVHEENIAAQAIYRNLGFAESGRNGIYIEMQLTNYDYLSIRSSSEGIGLSL